MGVMGVLFLTRSRSYIETRKQIVCRKYDHPHHPHHPHSADRSFDALTAYRWGCGHDGLLCLSVRGVLLDTNLNDGSPKKLDRLGLVSRSAS